MTVRRLANDDRDALEAFLVGHAESSMFLRANARASGLEGGDEPFHGDYVAAFGPDGAISGVIALYWNGNVMVQVPDRDHLTAMFGALAAFMTRPIAGFLGPSDQVEAALACLGLADATFNLNHREALYALDLARLVVPPLLAGETVVHAGEIGPGLLFDWLRAYDIEALNGRPGVELDKRIDERVARMSEADNPCWALLADGEPVSLAGFNATLPDMVQVGPVWTPPNLRGRGFARRLLADNLRRARDRDGATKSVLFTGTDTAARIYEALGFRACGDYHMAFLREPVPASEISARMA